MYETRLVNKGLPKAVLLCKTKSREDLYLRLDFQSHSRSFKNVSTGHPVQKASNLREERGRNNANEVERNECVT